MITEKIKLGCNNSFLTTYIPETYESFSSDKKWPVIVICPGGGYGHLSDREAEPVALKMMSLGFAAAVLTYTLAPMKGGEALEDAAAAVRTIRKNADKWHLDVNKVVVCGFSAGAHLAASLACHCPAPESRPDYLLLCYPVITADPLFCHKGSIENVCGTSGKYTKDYFSLENHVTKDFPPVFMWHTNQDEAVPLENSLKFASELRKNGVDFEYHIFNKGKHGLALATSQSSKSSRETIEPQCAQWVELFKNWCIGMGIISA